MSPGDLVEFDGSETASTLMVPRAGYAWNFGDGTTATGPSVVHTFAQRRDLHRDPHGDRPRRKRAEPRAVDHDPGRPPAGTHPALTARVQMLPQSLRAVLRSGLAVRLTVNMASRRLRDPDGAANDRAPRPPAHGSGCDGGDRSRHAGRSASRHEASSTCTFRRRPRAGSRRLRHLSLTLRLTLVGAGRIHQTVDAAGRY